MSPPTDGPTLATYVETRFNLLTESLKDLAAAQSSALGAAIEATKAAHNAADVRYQQSFAAAIDAARSSVEAVKVSLEASIAAADLRYQQRFIAQADALAAAFSAAKEAVSAALAAQDRAVLKAELSADKRFEALNELRQMLNDTLKILMTITEVTQMVGAVVEKVELTGKRSDALEARLNTLAGESSGNRRMKDDTRNYLVAGVSILFFLLALATFIFARIG